MKCYLSRNYKGVSSSGYKAKTDMEDLMAGWGFRNIGLKRTFYPHVIVSFVLTLFGVLKALVCLRKGDILFLQYPLKKYFSFICNVAHFKGCKIVILIHDLGSFRRKKLSVSQEIKRLEHADYIIATNPAMQQWIKDRHCQMPVGYLGVWDYLSVARPDAHKELPSPPYQIVYAGALSRRKNAFLYSWGEKIEGYSVNLYGSGFFLEEAKGREHFRIKGFVQSDTLIESVEGDFGLVWDGDSVETCCGDFGEYLQFNTPHKTSLYIRCGLPVIIWERAALAPFVQSNRLGLCIGKLEDLNRLLLSITVEEYREMRNNVLRMSDRISKGFYFKQAAEKAIAFLQTTNQ